VSWDSKFPISTTSKPGSSQRQVLSRNFAVASSGSPATTRARHRPQGSTPGPVEIARNDRSFLTSFGSTEAAL
jgi:hypothetical protein